MPAAKKNTATQVPEDASTVDGSVAVKEAPAPAKPAAKNKPLSPNDEVEVVSSVPYRVSYEDKATSDRYVWVEMGDTQFMTLDALTRMRRNYPSYFEKMEVMPTNEAVIKKLNLTRLCDKTSEFLDVASYTREKVGETCEKIKALDSGVKLTVVQKIKGMVESGEIFDVAVIRTIEKRLGVDLVSVL